MRSHGVLVRAAVGLVERFVPDGEALAGDLVEEHGRGRSAFWVWQQAFGPGGHGLGARADQDRAHAGGRSRRRVRARQRAAAAARRHRHERQPGRASAAWDHHPRRARRERRLRSCWFLLAAIVAGAGLRVVRIRRGRGLPAARAIVPLRGC
ncbi:MAG: hypothetical protein R2708_18085 [Vicinamibacterales bacterium]